MPSRANLRLTDRAVEASTAPRHGHQEIPRWRAPRLCRPGYCHRRPLLVFHLHVAAHRGRAAHHDRDRPNSLRRSTPPASLADLDGTNGFRLDGIDADDQGGSSVLLRHKLWFSANHPLGAIAVGPSRPERGHCGCRQPDLGDNLRRRFAFCNPPVNLLSEPFPAFLDTTPGDAERVGEIPKSDSPLADGVVDFLVGAISVCQSSSPGGDPGSAASRRASASTPTRLAGLGRGAEKICGCRAARDRGRTGARRLIGSAAAQATRAVEPRAAGEPVDCGGSSGLEPTK